MRVLIGGLVYAGWLTWVLAGTVTMLRHNREKRQALAQLQGHDVDLEYRVGRSRITDRRIGRLYADESRWYVALRGGSRNSAVPLPAIRSITERSTGQEFGPWT